MFGEDSSDQATAAEPAAAAAPAENRSVGPVREGLIGDPGNARYDESISRRPVTTVRPLEDEPAEAVAPEPAPTPVPQQESSVQSEPVAPVIEARPSGSSPVIAESAPAPTPIAPSAGAEAPVETADAAPAPAPMVAAPSLVADTSALDAAVTQAYGGRPMAAAGPRVQPLVPAAVVDTPVGGPYGGYAPAGGPVVVGGAVAQPAMQPAVVDQGGTVVVGGGAQTVVVGGGYGGVAAGPAYGSMPGGEPVAIIHFDFGSTGLSARDRQVIRQVADIQARQGGFVKVVGHSSRFTANMPQDQHMLVNFETSVERADTVAQALVREGVPPEVVETAAMGASQPRYQEVMPAGQVGNQRVEIYLVR